MIRLSRSRWILLLAIVALAVIGLSGGCSAHRRPSPLSPQEQSQISTAPLPYSVTVSLWDNETKTGQNAEAYAEPLAKLLAASRAFKSVRFERSSAPSGQDLVATSTGLYCNTAVIPLLSIISLGIIPTIFDDEQCEGMLLRRAPGQRKNDGVEITMRYKGKVIMGWVAVVLGALPGWSYGDVAGDPRFAERFRLAIIARRSEIERLVSQH